MTQEQSARAENSQMTEQEHDELYALISRAELAYHKHPHNAKEWRTQVHEAEEAIFGVVELLLAAKQAEIDHLTVQLVSIRGIHAVAVEKCKSLNADSVVAMFQAAQHLGHFADEVADILNMKRGDEK